MNSKIIGCGSYLPSKVLTNYALEEIMDTSNEWINSRTGISQRHIAADDEGSTDMAYKAALEAVKDAKINVNQIDLIINCTTSPDNIFPSSAVRLQAYLGIPNIPAFDLQAVCSGFIYGLHLADSLISSGKYNIIMLSCSEKMSKLINWNDRNTAVLFGDGAGVVILAKNNEPDKGVLDSIISSDGNFYHSLFVDNETQMIQMHGKEVFKHAVDKMVQSILEILIKNNLTVDDIDYIVPHQANLRIIKILGQKLNVPASKIITVIEKHANCSAASIPLAFTELKSSGKLKSGDKIVFAAFGAGFTWGSAIIVW